MRFFRVGLPALTGAVLLLLAVQSTGARLGEPDADVVDVARSSLPSLAIAVLLLLASLAISGRSRSGFVLGAGTAVAMVLAGVAAIVVELPYVAEGGLGAAIGGGVMVLSGIWIAAWLVYGLLMLRARTSFAAAWQPQDRRFAIVMGSLAVFAAAAYLGLGVVATDRAAADAAGQADAATLVAGTTVNAQVVESTLGTSASLSSGREVKTLTLDLRFSSPAAYALAQVPTVCLVDAATALDPGFKPDTFCWGTAGPAVALADGFRDLTMPASGRHVRLVLSGTGSPCAFDAGPWQALVGFAPSSAGLSGVPETYSVTAPFVIESATAPAASGAGQAASGCIASTVSP